MKKIVAITGPESTAKSTLTIALAKYYQGNYFMEYAREYLKEKGHNYKYEDVEAIAKKQVDQYKEGIRKQKSIIFFDTWLIITKIWFIRVFKRIPDWLETAIEDHPIDLYLLCKPDIPWEPDPLRENGGKERLSLFQEYKEELIRKNYTYIEIGGVGEERINNAIKAIDSII